MARIDNLGDKAGINGFHKNKQNINKLGRPRKSFAAINSKLEEKGVQKLTKKQLLEFYERLFNATEEELIELRNDKEVPFALKLIIHELGSAHTRSKALQDYRDYMFKEVESGPEKRMIGYGSTNAEQNLLPPSEES